MRVCLFCLQPAVDKALQTAKTAQTALQKDALASVANVSVFTFAILITITSEGMNLGSKMIMQIQASVPYVKAQWYIFRHIFTYKVKQGLWPTQNVYKCHRYYSRSTIHVPTSTPTISSVGNSLPIITCL